MKRIPLPAKTLEEYKTIFGLPKGYDPDKLRKSVDIYLSRYIEGEGKGIGFLFPATSAISYYYFMKGLAKSLFPKAKLKMISPEQRRLDNDELHETSPEVSERAKRNLIPQLKNFAQLNKIVVVDNHYKGKTSNGIRLGLEESGFENKGDNFVPLSTTRELKGLGNFNLTRRNYNRNRYGENLINLPNRARELLGNSSSEITSTWLDVNITKKWQKAQRMGLDKKQFLKQMKTEHLGKVMAAYNLGILYGQNYGEQEEDRKPSLEQKVYTVTIILGLIGSLIFLYPSLTGNVVNNF